MRIKLIHRKPGVLDYLSTYARMQDFTRHRDSACADEVWSLQHLPVYTLGMAARPEHVLEPGTIPVLQTDRGGQVTYHGPGQLVTYLLIDLRRIKTGIREYVRLLEQGLIDYLHTLGLQGERKPSAPGVYIEGRKIAALGVRVKRGCCYHGIALNVDMDLKPFSGINPCGYAGLEVTQLRDYGINMKVEEVMDPLCGHLLQNIYQEYPSVSVLDTLVNTGVKGAAA